MIAGSTRGSGGGALARHLLSRKGGQTVRTLEARHLAAADLSTQLRELVAASRHGRTDRPIHHVHIDPPPGSDAGNVMKTFVALYEAEFGLQDVQKCGVEHIKHGRPHYHLIYSLVTPSGRVADLRHEYARREKISRLVEFECKLPWTQGKHSRAVAYALRGDGRADVADAMEAAGLLSGRRPIAIQSPRERAQAERTDVPIADVRAAALTAWRTSDSGAGFSTALAEHGLHLAAGRRGPVLVDRAGAVHSLSRTLSAAARIEGGRITVADIRKRIGGITLPDLEILHDRISNARALAESRGGDISGGARRSRSQQDPVAAPDASRGTGGARFIGRDQVLARDHRRDPGPTFADARRDQDQGRTRWSGSDRLAARHLRSLDLAPIRAQADSIRLASSRKTIRDRVAAQLLSRIDIRKISEAALQIAAGGHASHSRSKREDITMKSVRGFRGFRPRKQAFKSRILEELVPGFDAASWSDDLHRIDRDRPLPRIQLRDRGWVEFDPKACVVRTWGQPGRASALADAIANAQGWHVETLRPAGSITASPERPSLRRSAEDIELWWRERGYDAVRAEDGVWVNAGSAARIQDLGDQLHLHGDLTPEAARAMLLKAAEAWGGEAELSGSWSQTDKDLLWIEAQRAGVRLAACEPSSGARAKWQAETAEAARLSDTIGLVRSSTAPARLLLDAAAGDVSALARLDPDLRAFVSSYLDDDQRGELANADIADIVPELHRFRDLGAAERSRTDEEQNPRPGASAPLDMSPPPTAPGP